MQHRMLEIKYSEGWKNEELALLTLYTARLWQDSFKPVQLLIQGRKVLARESDKPSSSLVVSILEAHFSSSRTGV